jgi:hypothetical protein
MRLENTFCLYFRNLLEENQDHTLRASQEINLPSNSNLERMRVFHYNKDELILQKCTVTVYDVTDSRVVRHSYRKTTALQWEQPHS